jgi:hypothetical protein
MNLKDLQDLETLYGEREMLEQLYDQHRSEHRCGMQDCAARLEMGELVHKAGRAWKNALDLAGYELIQIAKYGLSIREDLQAFTTEVSGVME